MKNRTNLAVLILSLFMALFAVDVASAQSGAEAFAAGIPVSGRTVILGTWSWDIERNEQVRSKFVDVWWEQVNGEKKILVPIGRAGITRIPDRDYDSIGIADLAEMKYGRKGLENTFLTPGAVLALRTAEGNYAKIKVIGYRPLHDFSFEEVKLAGARWKNSVVTQPDVLEYHLEVEWTLYPKPAIEP